MDGPPLPSDKQGAGELVEIVLIAELGLVTPAAGALLGRSAGLALLLPPILLVILVLIVLGLLFLFLVRSRLPPLLARLGAGPFLAIRLALRRPLPLGRALLLTVGILACVDPVGTMC